MGSFGERMQREREMRSITLDEIAEHTKISKRNLTALEEENFSQLPGGIFNKGFVRAYAKYLGVDEEQAVADYLAAESEKLRKRSGIVIDQATGEDRSLRPQLVASESLRIMESEPQPAQAAGFMRAAILLVVLLGIGGLAYKWLQSRNANPPAEVVQAKTQPVAAALVTSPPEPIKPQPAQTPAASAQVATPSSETLPKANEAAVVSDPSSSSQPAAASFNLAVKTKEESWVQVKSDGKVLLEGVLPANTNKTFDASKELIIKLGNAAGVELAYNGKPLPQFENVTKGKTKTLTFTPQGLAESVR
jgi:cytoskeleton protein RodZ